MSQQPAILYIDDEEDCLQAFALVLESQYTVYLAHNLREALEAVRQHPEIGVAVVDWLMRDENGTQVIEALKATRPDVVCIVYTSVLLSEMRRSELARLSFAMLEKPLILDSPEFQDWLKRACLEHRRLKNAPQR